MDYKQIRELYSNFIIQRTYTRFRDDLGRRETWEEAVDRYKDFLLGKINFDNSTSISTSLFEEAIEAIKNKQVMPSMRLLWTAGTAANVDPVCAYNCGFIAVTDIKAFSEMMYLLMNGVGVGFSVERQFICKLPEVSEEEYPDQAQCYTVDDSKEGWSLTFKTLIKDWYHGIPSTWNVSKVRPKGTPIKGFGGRACLTGDTIVYKDKKKSQAENEITIKDLFDLQNGEGKWKHKPNHFKQIKLRSLSERDGVFYRNQVLEVIDNGLAPVYEIITKSGYKIKATGNHRFMKDTGDYDYVDNFSVGDLIAVNGSSNRKTGICKDCGTPVYSSAIRCRPCANKAQLKINALETTARQRKDCRDALKDFCELCGNNNVRLEIHHKDKNPFNNDKNNLITLCPKCHRYEHMSKDFLGNPYTCKYLNFDEIISIEYYGVERVYDLRMQAPDHNFVANGFVSHNSGPEVLVDLFNFTKNIIYYASGRKLNSKELADIICKIADIVIAGGVRRSATICISNLSDQRMKHFKDGQFWNDNPQRALANISVAYTEKPDVITFMEECRALILSRSGERGLINVMAFPHPLMRLNPCAERVLKSRQLCNLTEVPIEEGIELEEIERRVRLAVFLGTLQATLTTFNTKVLSKEWVKNTIEDAMLGVSLTGTSNFDWTPKILSKLRDKAKLWNREFALALGINPAYGITCNKPSGTVSQVVGTPSGIHPEYAPFYIRRVRVSRTDPICTLLIDSGIPHQPEVGTVYETTNTFVFEFPLKSSSKRIKNTCSALEQLEYYKLFKEHWCDERGNPSCTIYVREHEWLEVFNWVYHPDNWDYIGGLSFLPYDTGVYQLAPYEEITEERFNQLCDDFPNVDFSKLADYEKDDRTTGSREYACSAGQCELK